MNRANPMMNMLNQPGVGPRRGDRADSEPSPLTGEGDFSNWSQRLSDVEEMVDEPDLRNQLAREGHGLNGREVGEVGIHFGHVANATPHFQR